MKFLFIAILTIISLVAGSTPKDGKIVTPSVLESFNTSFTGAEEVKWSETRDYFKAEFFLNCQYVFAFYSKSGSLIATTRNMLFTELPVILQSGLKESYAGYWISDLFEFSNEEGTDYYITLENAGEKIVLRSSKSSWTYYQKRNK